MRADYDRAMAVSPYAEAYANAMRVPGTPTYQFHRATYGDMPHEGFREMFERELHGWDPDAWAEQFRRSGARYVVMVTKHHDGYSMWPTATPHSHRPNWHCERDLVDEQTDSLAKKIMRLPPMRGTFDVIMKTLISRRPPFIESVKPATVPHADFTTPEYTQYETTHVKKWETTRGMGTGTSFGYNRAESESHYASLEDTQFPSFADAVAKNGNFLINVGGGQGNIPREQRRRLEAFGHWLRANGHAIFQTRPYAVPQARAVGGEEIRLTFSAEGVNLIILGWPRGWTVVIQDLHLPGGPATVLADNSRVQLPRR